MHSTPCPAAALRKADAMCACVLQAAFRRRQSSVVANVLQRHAPPSLQLQGPRADAAAAALMDNVRVAVYHLVATFDGLQGLLDKVSRPPIYAQLADVKTALATFIVEK